MSILVVTKKLLLGSLGPKIVSIFLHTVILAYAPNNRQPTDKQSTDRLTAGRPTDGQTGIQVCRLAKDIPSPPELIFARLS